MLLKLEPLPGLKIHCLYCGTETYSSPPINTKETRQSKTICQPCRKEMGK